MQFRTKARAVDLLGKGQIADLPTAISELWKNGYDAYADNLSATLYTKGYEDTESPIFTLSDDGRGMSHEDLTDKWLILGTDSKSRGKKPVSGQLTLWKKPRPIMGEKGIGRLSVSYLGSPMLMLTKRVGSPLQALYFDWRTLENYNLFLEDINIPICSIHSEEEFYSNLQHLKQEFLLNFITPDDEKETEEKQKPWQEQKGLLDEIIHDTLNLKLPSYFIDELVSDLIGNGNETHGTRFIIFKPDEQFTTLKKWINQKNNADDQDLDSIEDLRTGLVGFYNEFLYSTEESDITSSFIIKDKTGVRDFIGNTAFFNNADFEKCDHLIDGKFDEYGTFKGKIRVYEKEIENFEFRPNKPADSKTPYGPFSLKLGYVPGTEQSSLKKEIFDYYDAKLKAFGGLYVYRDNLRVLPYGRPHSDFLQFEERRSKHAGTHFFSYRRMFGYVSLKREFNKPLQDKAGREGFINNKAFREFKTDLTALFQTLAKEFFGTGARQDFKRDQLQEIKDAKGLEKEEQKLEKEERKAFKNHLKAFPDSLKEYEFRLSKISKVLTNKLSESNIIYHDIESLLRDIDRLKVEFDSLLPKKPKRFKMDSRDREHFENIVELYNETRGKTTRIDKVREQALEKLKEEQLLKEYENKFKYYLALLDEVTDKSTSDLQKAFDHIGKEFQKIQSEFDEKLKQAYTSNLPSPPTKENLDKSLQGLEFQFSDIRLKYQNILDAKSDHLLRLSFDIDDDVLVGFYKDRYEKTLKELGDFKNLAQLGISVEIINHELNSMYSQLSSSISEVGKYLKTTKEAEKHYKYLKNSFEHLDTKYQSLNPLYRKSRRTKRYIKGNEIHDYLQNFFEETFKDENVILELSDAFLESETYTFESVLFPAFVNVINNALYWIRSVKTPKILIDYDINSKSIIVCNNGPKIRDSSLEEIFELFYTRRPKGRGLGLYLSKDGLNTVGLDITASNSSDHNKLDGAAFLIAPMSL